MRWLVGVLLVAVLLVGCGEDRPCKETPLGPNTCTHIDGIWRLEALAANADRPRCGALVLSHPVTINSAGSELSGVVDGSTFEGVNYESGAFIIESHDGLFTLRGAYRELDGTPELSGGVSFGGFGQTCDALWDFTARRE